MANSACTSKVTILTHKDICLTAFRCPYIIFISLRKRRQPQITNPDRREGKPEREKRDLAACHIASTGLQHPLSNHCHNWLHHRSRWRSNGRKFVTDIWNYVRRLLFNFPRCLRPHKTNKQTRKKKKTRKEKNHTQKTHTHTKTKQTKKHVWIERELFFLFNRVGRWEGLGTSW